MAVLRTKPVGYASFAALVLFFCLIGPLAYADNLPPLPPSIAPSNGTSNFNQQVIFNTIYSDPDGYSNIQYAQLIINLSVTGANGFLGYYIQATNKLYLMNDDGTSWQGGFVPGSSNTIENSYCKLDCSKTTVSGSGNAFTINWAITFKAAFIGSKNIYLFVRDNSAAFYGWMYAGTWAIVNQPPMVISISPSNSVSNPNQEVLFTTVYSDQNGCSDIQYVHLLINASISGSSGFLGYYIQATNKIYIMNDSGSSWLGGYAPGSTNVIENSYCKLDYSKTTVSGSGNNLTVSWSLTFKSSFQGVKNTYLFVRDNLGAYYGWAFGGTWRINQAPSIVSFLPSSGSSNSDQQVIFSTTFSDPDGWQDIQYAQNFYDILRIDHVVGLFRIWSIPFNEPEENIGLNGSFDPPDESKWLEHGRKILKAMLDNTDMALCAEDLGVIPKVCTDTLKELGIPGNDVQRWVKDWNILHDFLEPKGYRSLSVAMLSTHDTTNWPAWWENEAGTVDEALFIRKCNERGIDYAKAKDQLFDFNHSAHGRLRWLNSIDSVEKFVLILGKRKEELKDFIDLYENSYLEKEKLWKHLGLLGPMREKSDPEIVREALKITLDSSAVFCVNTIIDWLYLADIFKGDAYQYRINTPGTISDKNWSLRLPFSLEELLKHKVTKQIRKMIEVSERI